jgi:hypothetical protein
MDRDLRPGRVQRARDFCADTAGGAGDKNHGGG